jgi:hypothetical protein
VGSLQLATEPDLSFHQQESNLKWCVRVPGQQGFQSWHAEQFNRAQVLQESSNTQLHASTCRELEGRRDMVCERSHGSRTLTWFVNQTKLGLAASKEHIDTS